MDNGYQQAEWREFYIQRDRRQFYAMFDWLLRLDDFYAMMGY